MIKRFLKNKSGATVVEYGLIVAVLSLTIVAGVSTATNSVKGLFTDTASRFDGAE
jgi:pilus assembly protein Flp/PilA